MISVMQIALSSWKYQVADSPRLEWSADVDHARVTIVWNANRWRIISTTSTQHDFQPRALFLVSSPNAVLMRLGQHNSVSLQSIVFVGFFCFPLFLKIERERERE